MSDFIGTKLTMNLGERSYDIILKNGALENLYQFARLDRKVAVVTDSGVPAEYAQRVADQCRESTIITVPQGEASKSFKILETVLRQMLEFNMGRGDLVVAVGGGVVGDLAGFAAAIYMRGIDFINCPTTTLSMIDSSIGGKTAVDLGDTKNIVGAFWQPKLVIVDPATLSTLPRRHYINGLAEAVKAGLLADPELFAIFEKGDIDTQISEIIYRSLRFKKNVVEQDETERGMRKALNFGHTIGHGIEAVKGIKGRRTVGLFHGECVALGMLPMIESKALQKRVRAVYRRIGLPTRTTYNKEKVLAEMLHDKKAQGGQITVIKVPGLGCWRAETIPVEGLRPLLGVEEEAMKNTFGSDLSLTIFGESHGRAVGAVLDGMAAGVPVDEAFLAACMDKRRARGDGLSTTRVEGDAVQFLSGVVNGRTTGTAIALMIENQNTRSGDYAKTADLLRPGHADYTAYAKYHGYQDARGGGHFSGRVTAALVAGGALVLGALNRAGIEIVTHIGRCAGISDAPFALDDPAALAAQAETLLNKSEGFALLDGSVEEPMKAAIRAAGAEGDSVGGVLETAILGLPAGVGEPYFDSVESKLAHLAFSIPAVKGIEFGSGFGFVDQKGSEANDAFRMQGERIVTATNHNAGLNGGISNGMPVVFRTAVKPTPSIYKTQDTVDYMAKKDAELSIQGRHDPCIVPRAAIVQTCAAALAVGDLLTAKYGMAWMEDPTGYRKEVL